MAQGFWTDPRVASLKSFWARGYSAGAIAELLGATKNAVVGKADRLDLGEHRTIYRLPVWRGGTRRRRIDHERRVPLAA